MNKKCFEHNCVNFSDRSKCVKERRAVTDGNPDWVTSIQFKPFFSPSAWVSETRFLQQLTWTYQLDRPSNVAIRSYRKGYQMPSVSNSTRRIRRKGRKSIINFMCMHRLIRLLTWREKMLLFFVKRCAVDKTKKRDEKRASDFKLKSAIESRWTLFMAEIKLMGETSERGKWMKNYQARLKQQAELKGICKKDQKREEENTFSVNHRMMLRRLNE